MKARRKKRKRNLTVRTKRGKTVVDANTVDRDWHEDRPWARDYPKGTSGNPKGPPKGKVDVVKYLKKMLAGPAQNEKFESLAEELSDIMIQNAMNGKYHWLESVLRRVESRKITRDKMLEYIEFMYVVMSKHVRDEDVRAKIFEDLQSRLKTKFNPPGDEDLEEFQDHVFST